jgi:tyrosine-protein kinase Etk/Wzc
LFRSESIRALLTEVRSVYRYIVIDTPPVLGANEALCLANAADLCVVCGRWGVSRIDRVQAACERLFSSEVCPVGIVLNGVPFRHYAYRYGRCVYQSPASLEQV